MAYFTPDFAAFLRELEKCNNKEWFDANRSRYEESVREPFFRFVAEVIEKVSAVDPAVDISPKEAIFRINRDIRFSKDKRPYKTSVSAVITPGGRKTMHVPGLYLELRAREIRVYGGAHMLDTAGLLAVRRAIAVDPKRFRELVSAKAFTERYGEVLGGKHKRIPPEFREVAEQEPLMANKQFYYFAKLKPALLTDDSLIAEIMECYNAGRGVMHFLRAALGG